ncbi:VCBS repeat-containing protein [Microbacterium enclense]|uniref:VCBS repeat-containing protein n=1 Tax=Microbacterium enclense TaxID=993073 RepID=UPI0021A4DC6C|nr:VCBS repeat-containing protein [Microbacterium enclense]MCT2084708.1 VCBS repeat-containing protein [Microbacterium enclense]
MTERSRPRAAVAALAAWVCAAALLVALPIALPATVAPVASASAANAADWNPGHIIDDALFYDGTAMTSSEIQAFLQKRVPNCRSGYTCLKDYRQDTNDRPADKYCNGYSGARNESAATIIDKVARSCGISQKALLVLIEKEQRLVSSTWPEDFQYRAATGQGCPDTAACDPSTAGFFYQVYYGARQFEIYRMNPTWWGYQAGRWNNILYHPYNNCGTQRVYIDNAATAGLYIYTPYVPNAAALRNLYGEGDGCSAYGNRNFWRIFTDWFGSTKYQPPVPRYGVDSSLVAVDGSGQIFSYPFKGNAWGERVRTAGGVAATDRVLAVGDFDGDQRRDIVVVDSSKRVWLRPLEERAGDLPAKRIDVDWSDAAFITAAGDADGDGVPDVYTTTKAGLLLFWKGTGYGTFGAPRIVGSEWNGFTAVVGGADVTGDGRPDLLGRDKNGELWLYRGDGSGAWQPGRTSLGTGWGSMTSIAMPGDFTGDGIADLVAVDQNGLLWSFTGDNSGRFTRSAAPAGSGWNVMQTVTGEGARPGWKKAFPGGAGDLTGDGAADVVAVSTKGVLSVYPGDGSGGWRQPLAVSSTWGSGRVVPLGDFTGDGRADLGRITGAGQFELWRGRGDGTFSGPTVIGNGWTNLGLVTGGIDFDGDRRLDVVARDSSGVLWLYRGDGMGGWLTGQGVAIGSGWNIVTSLSAGGDLVGNRVDDLLVRRTDGTLWSYGTDGRGGWGTIRQIGSGWNVFGPVFATGNFDGAGGPDVMGRLGNGDLVLYRGDGGAGWLGSRVAGTQWNVMAEIR